MVDTCVPYKRKQVEGKKKLQSGETASRFHIKMGCNGRKREKKGGNSKANGRSGKWFEWLVS